MLWPSINLFEVTGYCLLYKYSVLPNLLFSIDFFLDLSDIWVVCVDSWDFVSNLVEFLHITLSEEGSHILEIGEVVLLSDDGQLLFFLL